MDIPPVVTPSGRFGDDRLIQFIGTIHPRLRGSGRRQCATVIKMFMHTVSEQEIEFCAITKRVKQPARAICIINTQLEIIGIFQSPLGIPAVEPPWEIINPAANRTPVMVIPVVISPKVVNNHIVTQTDRIQLLANCLIFRQADATAGGGSVDLAKQG